MVPIGVSFENLACSLVLLVDDCLHFLVDASSALFAIGLGEAVVLAAVVIGHVGEFAAHAVVGDHCIGNLCCSLEVVESASVDDAQEHFLGNSSCHERANLVE